MVDTFDTAIQPPDLRALNENLRKSLKTLHDWRIDSHVHRMEECVHSLTRPDDEARYCKSPLCLECRRWKATQERRVIKQLLESASNSLPQPPLIFFQTLRLKDALPAEVKGRVALLVSAFKKLRRKLPRNLGWTRTVETKSAYPDYERENCHLHFVMLFPAGVTEEVNAIQWERLWAECAGELVGDTDPYARMAESVNDVINYLTKGFAWDFADDGRVGAEDPRRYVNRIQHGHATFSSGGLLRLKVKIPEPAEMDVLTGLDQFAPTRSTHRNRARNPQRQVRDIAIEG